MKSGEVSLNHSKTSLLLKIKKMFNNFQQLLFNTPVEMFETVDIPQKLFLNGEFVEPIGKETFSVYNPKDGSVVSDKVPVANSEDIDLAVKYATAAFKGPWSKFTAADRARCMNKLCDILETELVHCLSLDSLTMGSPLSIIPKRDVGYIIGCFRYFSGWTDKFKGDYFPPDDGMVKIVRHEPIGVCAAVNPFNAPTATFALKAAPCLAMGNVLIVKPSEKAPFGSLAFASLFEKAGFPNGVVQVVTGLGATGALLASHMGIQKISFTGSVRTGKAIQKMAAESNMKRVTLELGGKSPAIIFEDANLDNAVQWAVNGIISRTGQLCVAASRVYVQESIADKFLEKYIKQMREAAEKIGDPQDEETLLGPLADKIQFERVMGFIERGKKQAQLVVGGVQRGDKGYFVEPTVFVNPQENAEIYKEEIFGPVSVVQTFKTEEEVLARANDTQYGLMGGVFTQDIQRALRISAGIQAGVVGVNCVSSMNMQVPFGGFKQSGQGREMAEYSLRAYTEPKTILINMNY